MRKVRKNIKRMLREQMYVVKTSGKELNTNRTEILMSAVADHMLSELKFRYPVIVSRQACQLLMIIYQPDLFRSKP